MEPFWDPNAHGAPHPVKYESDTNVSGFAYCNESSSLNFAASASASAFSEDDADFGPGRRGKASRQDPLSHRIIEKRRRDRMNSCLADLSRLIPTQYQRKGRGRIEKTEIIEMSIRYMKQLQNQEQLHKENMYKQGYDECITQVANYLFTRHPDLAYPMVEHLKEMKGDCMKMRAQSLDTASASSNSPPSSSHHANHHHHHHMNGGPFHPVAPLSHLRDILTASDTEHSSDHHDLADHDDHDDHLMLVDDDLQHSRATSSAAHRHNGLGTGPDNRHIDLDDDVKDLSLRRSTAAGNPLSLANVGRRSAATAGAPLTKSASAVALMQQPASPPAMQLQRSAGGVPAVVPAVNRLLNGAAASGVTVDFDAHSSVSRSSSMHNHHDNHSNISGDSPPPSSVDHHGDDTDDAHTHDHETSDHDEHDARPGSNGDGPMRSVRLRKLSHDTTATCAHDVIDHHHQHNSYKFKNYIQQRFTQDTIAHHHLHHEHHMHHDDHDGMSLMNGDSNNSHKSAGDASPDGRRGGGGGDAASSGSSGIDVGDNRQLMRLADYADEAKPKALIDASKDVSAFPIFKALQQSAGQSQQPPVGYAEQLVVPIFALHSHGRFYVPLSVEYKSLVPYLNGIDLLDRPAAATSPAIVGGNLPPLHSININVNFAASAAANASLLRQPKVQQAPANKAVGAFNGPLTSHVTGPTMTSTVLAMPDAMMASTVRT